MKKYVNLLLALTFILAQFTGCGERGDISMEHDILNEVSVSDKHDIPEGDMETVSPSISKHISCKVCGGATILCPYYREVIYVTKDSSDVYCRICNGWATLEFTGISYDVEFDDCFEMSGCRVVAHLCEGIIMCTYTCTYDCREPQEVTYLERVTHTLCGFEKIPTYINIGK